MKTTNTTLALLMLAAVVGCDGPGTKDGSASHVVEDLLAAIGIESPVGIYESFWEKIPDPALAVEIKEYAERTRSVIECDSRSCTGPGFLHPVTIDFHEPFYPDTWPINTIHVMTEYPAACMCGVIYAVEVSRTGAGGWSVGEAVRIGSHVS